jgi:protocatechuate 3,4-dioxygenase beta subunit
MRKIKVTARFLIPVAMLAVAALSASAVSSPAGGQRQMRNLFGHVLDHHDDPLAKAVVYLKNTKTLAVKTYISDADGTYRFPALSPNVDYEIYAEINGARSDIKTLSAFDNRSDVNLSLHIKKSK